MALMVWLILKAAAYLILADIAWIVLMQMMLAVGGLAKWAEEE